MENEEPGGLPKDKHRKFMKKARNATTSSNPFRVKN